MANAKNPSVLAKRLRKHWKTWRETLLPLVVLVVLFVLWEAAVWLFSVPIYMLPPPTKIAVALWEAPGAVAVHAWATFVTVMGGFILAIAVSLPLAAWITMSNFGRVAIYPLIILSQSIPKVALAPLLVVMLGTNAAPKIIVAMLVAFFPLVVSTATGLSAVPKELLELGRSLRAGPMKELLRIRLPYAVPFIFSGLKMAITLSVIGAVVGEFVAADRGLGFLMTSSLAFFNTPMGFGAIVVLSVLAMVLFQIIAICERVFFPWSLRMQN